MKYSNDYKPNNNNMSDITIKVKKEDLIEVLKENRDKHQVEYDKAYKGYQLLVTKALETKLELVKSNKKFDMFFGEIGNEPDCHVDDYQNVIDMLNITNDTEIMISMSDYLKFYQNKWSWYSHWSLSNKTYVDAFHSSNL